MSTRRILGIAALVLPSLVPAQDQYVDLLRATEVGLFPEVGELLLGHGKMPPLDDRLAELQDQLLHDVAADVHSNPQKDPCCSLSSDRRT